MDDGLKWDSEKHEEARNVRAARQREEQLAGLKQRIMVRYRAFRKASAHAKAVGDYLQMVDRVKVDFANMCSGWNEMDDWLEATCKVLDMSVAEAARKSDRSDRRRRFKAKKRSGQIGSVGRRLE